MNELEKEFEEAIAKYNGIITKVCYYFSAHSDEFKDMRQEVLYNIWKGWEGFRNNSKLSTWIYRICFNTCVSFQRKHIPTKAALPIEEVVDLGEYPEMSMKEKYDMMHKMISRLNFEDRAIILLWLDEKTYEEIAELTGINRNTIAVRIKRIKEKLIKMSDL